MHYNFVRLDKTARVTPAMADWLWEISDIVEVLEKLGGEGCLNV
jgi:hypothetical protein